MVNVKKVSHCVKKPLSRNFISYLRNTGIHLCVGRAIAQVVSRWHPTLAAHVRVRAEHVQFVVDKVALEQVFSEYIGFPCQ
jgi:hypothetical protein